MKRGVCAGVLATAGFAVSLAQAQLAVTVRNGVNLGTSVNDQHGSAFTVAGLSGISYLGPYLDSADTSDHHFAMVMDNSNKLVSVVMKFATDGTITSAVLNRGLSLALTRDFEDVVYTGEARDSVFVCEEDTPQVHEFSLEDGSLIRSLPVPSVFANRRANFGFEAMSLQPEDPDNGNPGGDMALWAINEEALSVDGPQSTSTAGTVVRALHYVLAGGVGGAATTNEQFAIVTDPIHAPLTTGARSGVSALALLPSGGVLILERSFGFSFTSPFQSRIYEVSGDDLMNVAGFASLIGVTYTPVSKRLLYVGNQTNMEGLCLGPKLAPHTYALVGVVDDGDPISVNRVVGFVLTGVPSACRADFNDDGFLDFSDFDEFVVAFEAGQASSDFNGDGFLDFSDFDDFVSAFESGC